MATRTNQKPNQTRNGFSSSSSSGSLGDMGPVDSSSNSSTIALIAATTAVVVFLLLAPVFLDMYLTSVENKSFYETKSKQQDIKIDELAKQLKDLKDKNE